ncbi:recombinase RecT, partial [Escherichia coli]|nr:recombinase RecT [Escherichia coli]
MSQSKATVPKHLEGKPADCLAVTMQAAQWG